MENYHDKVPLDLFDWICHGEILYCHCGYHLVDPQKGGKCWSCEFKSLFEDCFINKKAFCLNDIKETEGTHRKRVSDIIKKANDRKNSGMSRKFWLL